MSSEFEPGLEPRATQAPEPPLAPGERVPKAESSGCTLGISLSLMVMALSIVMLVVMRFAPMAIEGEVDVDQLVGQTFAGGVLPFDLVESGARDFRGRAVVLRLARKGLDEDREAVRLAMEAAAELGEGASDEEQPEEDQDQDDVELDDDAPSLAIEELDVEPGSLGPDELLVVNYLQVESLIGAFKTGGGGFAGFGREESDEDISRKLRGWKKAPNYDWQTTLMRDKVRWDGWEADFHIDRSFREGGSWSDSVKLNLGRGKHNTALYATWRDGYVVTRADVERLARTVKM